MADPSPTLDAMNARLSEEHLRIVVDGGLQEHWDAHGVCISFLCREIDALRLELAEARAEIRLLSGKGTPGLTVLEAEEVIRSRDREFGGGLRAAEKGDDNG